MSERVKRIGALCILWVLLLPAARARAGEPTDQVKASVDAVLEVLRDAEMKKPQNTTERRAAIRKIVLRRFDFEEMSRRSLARHWKQRTPEERNEFVPLYTDLLERTYINKIEQYEDEQVLYVEERTEDRYAAVKTLISGTDLEIPITYRLHREKDQWLVYDVVIEGVSLVRNYRTQFNSIIRSESYETLLERLRAKVEESQ